MPINFEIGGFVGSRFSYLVCCAAEHSKHLAAILMLGFLSMRDATAEAGLLAVFSL